MSLFVVILFVGGIIGSQYEPNTWYYNYDLNRYVLFNPNCIDINYGNYNDICGTYNISSKPMELNDINQVFYIYELISHNYGVCHDMFIFGGNINNNKSEYIWWNNDNIMDINDSMHDINGIYMGININNDSNNIVFTNNNVGGILCELIPDIYKPTNIPNITRFIDIRNDSNIPPRFRRKHKPKFSGAYIIIITLGIVLICMIGIFVKSQSNDNKKIIKSPPNIGKKINSTSVAMTTHFNNSNENINISCVNGEEIPITIPNKNDPNNNNNNNISINDDNITVSSFKLPKTPNVIVFDTDDLDDMSNDDNKLTLNQNDILTPSPPQMKLISNNNISNYLTSPRKPKTPNMMESLTHFNDDFDDESILSDTHSNINNDIK